MGVVYCSLMSATLGVSELRHPPLLLTQTQFKELGAIRSVGAPTSTPLLLTAHMKPFRDHLHDHLMAPVLIT